MEEPRLFLLDAYALIFRAYYGLLHMPRVTSEGLNTTAIFGFVNTLEEVLRKENPSHIAVCFDPQGPTFRHEAFKDYKGERAAMPEDIRIAVPYIKRIIEAYNIPVVEVPGFEADDVIGTLALRAEKEGFLTYMMTPDKDFGQLVSERTLQYKPSYRGQDVEIRGPKEVCERYGIQSTSQVIDLLALMGDKIDNIPGCPGVGEKTAVKLIGEFGSVENLIAGSEQLKGSLKKKVEENAPQIKFSKYLATIRTDVPVEIGIEELKRRPADTKTLYAIFKELEFRSLESRVAKRISQQQEEKEERPAASAQTEAVQGSLFDIEEPETPSETQMSQESPVPQVRELQSAELRYRPVESAEALSEMMKAAESARMAAIYVVAPGEGDMNADALAMAVATARGEAWFLDAGSELCLQAASQLFGNEAIEIVSADMKRSWIALKNLALRNGREFAAEMPERFFDTAVAHYLLQPDLRHTLEALAESYLGIAPAPLDGFSPEKGNATRRLFLPDEGSLMQYACQRADVALRLRKPLLQELESQSLTELYRNIELPLIPILASMERAGVRIDRHALRQAELSLSERMQEVEKRIWELAGEQFNVSSPAKVGEILFDKLKLDPKAKKTKTGKYSTNEEVLDKLSGENPIVDEILQYRQLKKLINTYLTALPASINPATGKIHTTYNQTVAATGRISSSFPNLQNIPVRQGLGREIRRAFIPDDGHLFLSADYSQIELRLVADFASDEVMREAFNNGTDIHAVTAARIFHKSLEEVTASERRKAKTANFGILYGISAFGLANRLRIPRTEAKELIDNYFATFPAIKQYMADSIKRAQEQGYVATIHGRRRMLPDIASRNPVVRGYAERNAINAPIQGSAADIIKIAMIKIAREMKARRMQSTMIMQVHDELNFDVVPDEAAELQELVTRCMQEAYSGKVTLTASSGIASNWLEAH